MDILLAALRFANLLFGAVLLGSMIMEFRMIMPLVRHLPEATAHQVLRFLSPIALRYVPQSGQISMAGALGIVALWPVQDLPLATGLLTVVGILLTLPAIFITYRWYLPTDARLREMPLDPVPADSAHVMERMSRLHTVRATFYSLGFVAFVLAAVIP